MSSQRRPSIDLTTTCDCRAVRLAAKGEVVSMLLCSCRNCQRVTGTGHSSVVLFPLDGVRVEGTTKTHVRPAESGALFTRHFCPDCGTTLYAQTSRAPTLCLLPAGLFAGQNDWFKPGQLLFARSHPAWDLVADHLPRHQTYREEL
ncbi:MAG: hypothetical protein ABS76_02690 [Pelagibacterium sp. SCN 64-44]|nr:MAG: hypothetical protein ABS76_02690 [Pelagibacterium sp. SCN 64-44]